jgi:hypothetical protein
MMARDAELEGASFGGFAGEMAPPSEPASPAPNRPVIPPPPWAIEPGLVEDTEHYPAKKGRGKGDAC